MGTEYDVNWVLNIMYLIDEWNQFFLPELYDEKGGQNVRGGDNPRRGENRRTHPVVNPRPGHAVHLESLNLETLKLKTTQIGLPICP